MESSNDSDASGSDEAEPPSGDAAQKQTRATVMAASQPLTNNNVTTAADGATGPAAAPDGVVPMEVSHDDNSRFKSQEEFLASPRREQFIVASMKSLESKEAFDESFGKIKLLGCLPDISEHDFGDLLLNGGVFYVSVPLASKEAKYIFQLPPGSKADGTELHCSFRRSFEQWPPVSWGKKPRRVQDDDNGDSEVTSQMLFDEDESMEE